MPEVPQKVGWCDLIRWMAPEKGAKNNEGIWKERDWWELHFDDTFKKLEERFEPEGFMLLENQLMDSHKFGRRFVLPFGGRSSYQSVPGHPISIDGTASGTVCVVGVYKRFAEPPSPRPLTYWQKQGRRPKPGAVAESAEGFEGWYVLEQTEPIPTD